MEISAKCSFLAAISVFNVLVTFDTVWLLASFLSYHPLSTRKDSACQGTLGESMSQFSIFETLFKDELLLALFILQHSLMARFDIEWLLDKIGLGVLKRCLYVLASCASLQMLMNFWLPVNNFCLWNAPSDGWNGLILWHTLIAVHFISWFAVYGGCLLVDIGELIGVKQVLYSIRGLHDPLKSKSESLLRYYKHMRHPSFIGFSLLFWGIPQMSLDRALLAVQLTLYMLLAWNTDERDIAYIRYQLEDKEAHVNGDWHHQTSIRKQH